MSSLQYEVLIMKTWLCVDLFKMRNHCVVQGQVMGRILIWKCLRTVYHSLLCDSYQSRSAWLISYFGNFLSSHSSSKCQVGLVHLDWFADPWPELKILKFTISFTFWKKSEKQKDEIGKKHMFKGYSLNTNAFWKNVSISLNIWK